MTVTPDLDHLLAGRYMTLAKEGGDYATLAKALGRQASGNLKSTVAAAGAIARSITMATFVLRAARQTAEVSQRSAATSEQMSASIDTISQAVTVISGQAEDLERQARDGSAGATQATAIMREIRDAVQQTNRVLERLRETARTIEDASDGITNIAFQTNILALNASVEAARAGSAGTGFAVVAEEVKRLASQTKDTTADIFAATKRLQDDIGSIGETLIAVSDATRRGYDETTVLTKEIAHLSDAADALRLAIDEVAATLVQQRQAVRESSQGSETLAVVSEDTSHRIEGMMDSLDALEAIVTERLESMKGVDVPHCEIHHAKAAHLLFMRKIASHLAGRMTLDPDALPHATSCAFGKWREAQRHGSNKALADMLREIDPPHHLVHDHSIRALRRHLAHDFDGAVTEFEIARKASEEVVAILDRIAR